MIYFMLLETEEDRKKFQEIYENNYLKMYYVAHSMGQNQADAENAVHDSFLSLAEKFTKYSHLSCSEMMGLCVSIVKNKVLDSIRRANRYSEAEWEDIVLYDETPEHDASRMAERQERAAFVHKAMGEISEILRETLALKYYYQLSNKEIARIQGVPVKTVEMRLFRGKKKFKEVWDEANG